MWIIPVLALVCGAFLGSIISLQIPITYAKYLSIAVLASMDSVLGGSRSALEGRFNSLFLLSGLFFNALIAAVLAYLGDRLGVDLYTAAIIVFGIRIFSNISSIRHLLMAKYIKSYPQVEREPSTMFKNIVK